MFDGAGGGGGAEAEEEEEDDVGEGGSDVGSDEDTTAYRNTQFEIESEDEGERGREEGADRDRERDPHRARDGRSSRSSEEGVNRRHSDKVHCISFFFPLLSSFPSTTSSSSLSSMLWMTSPDFVIVVPIDTL